MNLLLFALATLGCQTHRVHPAPSLQAAEAAEESREPEIPTSPAVGLDVVEVRSPPVGLYETIEPADSPLQYQDLQAAPVDVPEPTVASDMPEAQSVAASPPAINVERANQALRVAIPCGCQPGETTNPALISGCEERLTFDDDQTLRVDMTDGDQIHTVQVEIESGEMTRIFPVY